MYGFLLIRTGETPLTGILFPDGELCLDLPKKKVFASREKLLRAYPGASFQPIGPVVSSDLAARLLEEQYTLHTAYYHSMKEFISRYQAEINQHKTDELPHPGYLDESNKWHPAPEVA